MSKELRDRLHQVDPDLRIVPGYTHHREWLASAGIICRSCGREVFRSKEGLCIPCYEQLHEFEIIDTTGCLDFLPMSVLKEITRKPRGA